MRLILCIIALMFLPTAVFGADFAVSTDRTEYAPGANIVVDWTIPESTNTSRNWVAVYTTSASNNQYRSWSYLGSGRSGSTVLKESAPGTYEVRLLTNNGYDSVATSDRFTIDAVANEPATPDESGDTSGSVNENYSLDVSASSIGPSGSVNVEWSTNTNSTDRDWIGLYRTGSSDTSYINWFYVGNKTGSRSFTLRNSGEYEFRYFTDNGYDRQATSPTVTVQSTTEVNDEESDTGGGSGVEEPAPPASEYELAVTNTAITAGNTVTVSFAANANDNLQSDWVGLYRIGNSDQRYTDWKYTNGTNGELTFTTNNTGTYEFRYFKNNGYTKKATSQTFTVTAPDQTDSTDPTVPNDPSQPNTSYEVIADRSGYDVGSTANALWSAPSGANIVFDWIGLYRVGSSDAGYIAYKYVDIFSNRTQFSLNAVGTFEFRYFKNNSYRRVAVSEPFTVGQSGVANQCNGYDLDDVTNFPTKNGPIIALGDSITFGVGASPGEDYVEELEKRLGVNIINSGVPADTTADVSARLQRDVLSAEPSTVIIFIGGNDELRRIYESLSDSAAERELADRLDEFVRERLGYEWDQVPLLTRAETFANLQSIVTRIQATGANTIIVGFDNTLYNDTIEENYARIARETGSVYIPNIYNDIFGRPSRMSDLIHPNDVGYDIIADRIQRGLVCLVD